MNIAIVASRFNQLISDNLVAGAQKVIKSKGLAEADTYNVPGAYELPLACSLLSAKFDGLVAVGVVIRGETPHFDYVCDVASKGIAEVSRTKLIPIGFGVITADTVDQAVARSGDNEKNLGYRAALAAIELVEFKKEVQR